MAWTGTWTNQYGSVLEITSDAGGRIEGTVTSAVDGGIRGLTLPVRGLQQGDLVGFVVRGGPIVATWTRLLREGRMKTTWHVVATERVVANGEGEPGKRRTLGLFEAIRTGADTFVRAVGP